MNILPRKFYQRDTVVVAKKLLGKRLVSRINNQEVSGIITETEAYKHKDDPASHAYRRITNRNKAMFGEVGRSYVYFTYGIHYCFNVVAKEQKIDAGAVLIRGIKPEKGITIMEKNRKITELKNLANGPGKLTQAFAITNKHYGLDLTRKSKLYITEGVNISKKISETPRIGIKLATEKLWNFKVEI